MVRGERFRNKRPRLMLAVSPFNSGPYREGKGARIKRMINTVSYYVIFEAFRFSSLEYTRFRRLGGSHCLSFLARN